MANRHCDYLTGNDTTGTGDALFPFKTWAAGVSVAKGFVQGDTVIIHNDEPMTNYVTLPAMSSRLTVNLIVGVNSTTGLADGSRRVLSSSGGLANFIYQDVSTYQWSLENIEIKDFSGPVIQHSSTSISNPMHFYNVKFKNAGFLVGNVNSSAATDRMCFRRCTFEDITHNSNAPLWGNGTQPMGYFYDCIFIRCSTPNNTQYNFLYGFVFENCMFIDCSNQKYGVACYYYMNNIVVDRFTFTGTGDVPNVVFGFPSTSVSWWHRANNLLVTNIASAATQVTSVSVLFALATSAGQLASLTNVARWNAPNFSTVVRTSNPALYSVFTSNIDIELTKSPWKNDDSVVSNPLSAYEYAEDFIWRRKTELLSAQTQGYVTT